MTTAERPKSTTRNSPASSRKRAQVVTSLLIEEAATSWFRAQQAQMLSKHTLKLRGQAIGLLQAWLDRQGLSHQLADITKPQIEAWLVDLHRDYAPWSVLSYYNAMKLFFKWCVDEEELPHSPMARIKKPKLVEQPPQILTAEETLALLGACAGKDFYARRDRALLLLMIDTGMRLHEISQLHLDAVDMVNGTLTIMGKGGKARRPHFDVTAGAALDAYLRARSRYLQAHSRTAQAVGDALWVGHSGILTDSGIYKVIRRRAAQAGITTRTHPHLFRHLFAHGWLAAGGQEGDLAALAGWTPGSRMLYRYGAAQREERAREAHKKLSPANRLAGREKPGR